MVMQTKSMEKKGADNSSFLFYFMIITSLKMHAVAVSFLPSFFIFFSSFHAAQMLVTDFVKKKVFFTALAHIRVLFNTKKFKQPNSVI